MTESVAPAGLFDKLKSFITAPVPSETVTIKSPSGDTAEVVVKAMTGAVKKQYREAAKANKDDVQHAEAKLVVLSTFDPAGGSPLFTDEHIPLVKSAPYLFEGVLAAVNRVNGWRDDDEKKVG